MNEKNQILFKQYLDKSLDEEARRQFEGRLQSDKSFRLDFELFRDLQVHLEQKTEHAVGLNAIREVHREFIGAEKNTKKKKVIRLFPVLSRVAAALVLCLGAYFLLRDKKPVDRQAVFAEVYEEPPWKISRGGGELGELISLYKQGSKKFSIDSLLRYQGISNDERSYLIAELYMLDQQADSTLKYLDQINSYPARRDRILFIQTLSYFLKGDQKEIDNIVQSLPVDAHPYYRDKIRRLE